MNYVSVDSYSPFYNQRFLISSSLVSFLSPHGGQQIIMYVIAISNQVIKHCIHLHIHIAHTVLFKWPAVIKGDGEKLSEKTEVLKCQNTAAHSILQAYYY